MLRLFAVFHLNLAYSSIEEGDRAAVLERCYWPLLRLAEERSVPLGIEASGYTLETAAAIDPAWLECLRRLTSTGPCEFVGCGYTQIIGPLAPADVNAANLRLGQQVYERLLGFRPTLALVNEQAYSAGLVQHYLDAGFRAIITEWDNPRRCHPEWDAEWRYLPQIACGQHGEEIPLIWAMSIAFQKFQRYAQGEIELDEYVDYLAAHRSERARAFPLYCNDAEVFDFRPGRYHTEPALTAESEWRRIDQLFEKLLVDRRFQITRTSEVLDLMREQASGNRLQLGSTEQPIPVKKQDKYNITRWAVTGRDDLRINTACWRAYTALKANRPDTDEGWREICYLWSSDFRTHITDARWSAYREQLANLEGSQGAVAEWSSDGREQVRHGPVCMRRAECADPRVSRSRHFLTIETDTVKLCLNCRRGLAIEALWFKQVADEPLCASIKHGYYDDIRWGADYYTGHLVLESPGRSKITDLSPVEPVVVPGNGSSGILIAGAVATPLGPVEKRILVDDSCGAVELFYRLDWPEIPLGSLRLGHITLSPPAFDRSQLFYRSHNGGRCPEAFPLDGAHVHHGDPVSFLVSATGAVGMTEGMVELGDSRRVLRAEVDRCTAALMGMMTYCTVAETYFCRLMLSAAEMDETRRPLHLPEGERITCRIRLTAHSGPSGDTNQTSSGQLAPVLT